MAEILHSTRSSARQDPGLVAAMLPLSGGSAGSDARQGKLGRGAGLHGGRCEAHRHGCVAGRVSTARLSVRLQQHGQ